MLQVPFTFVIKKIDHMRPTFLLYLSYGPCRIKDLQNDHSCRKKIGRAPTHAQMVSDKGSVTSCSWEIKEMDENEVITDCLTRTLCTHLRETEENYIHLRWKVMYNVLRLSVYECGNDGACQRFLPLLLLVSP